MNPFLQKNSNKFGAIPFDKIKPEHFIPAIKAGIEEAKQNIQKLKANTAKPDFTNTIVELETSSEHLETAVGTYFVLYGAEASKELQALAADISQMHSAFSSDVSLDEDLFKKVKTVNETIDKKSLTPEQAQLLDKTYKSFSRNGALLSEKDKLSLRAIDQQLAALVPKFSENVLAATNAFELIIENASKLSGLPEDAKQAASELAEKKGHPGKWMFTLQMPSYLPVITYLDDANIRKQITMAAATKNFKDKFDNSDTVLKIVKLKHERANLLGYKTHADYVLEERMAHTPIKVNSFLERLLKYSKAAAERDVKEIESIKKASGNSEPLQRWDVSYYSEKLKKQKFDFDEEELRPYFELEKVYTGAFKLIEKLYGISFVRLYDIPVYHPEVITFEVKDTKSNEHVGLFYMDFHPRETKRGGAWMTDLLSQGLFKGQVVRPHIGIVMNFTRPTKTKPALLSFDEVNTFFHEFGHALHGLLSKCTYRSVAGTNVYWDFVELPSQFMENWILEKDVLDLFAIHYETGAKLPDDLFKKLKASSKFMAGFNSLRQINFAMLDMKWHSTDPSTIKDVESFEIEATERTQVMPRIPGTNNSVSFSHIFGGGYAAGYYSYKWAEVLDADAFEYFKENGLFSAEVAKKFRENILEKGGTEHPMELYKKFRGREPDPDSLLRRDGLI